MRLNRKYGSLTGQAYKDTVDNLRTIRGILQWENETVKAIDLTIEAIQSLFWNSTRKTSERAREASREADRKKREASE